MTEEYKVLINDRMTDISELKVTELKVELKKRGISTSGTKKDLYEKLKNYLIKTANSNSVENKNQMNMSISNDQLTINATQSDLDSSKLDSSFNESIKSQDKTQEVDVSMNESQKLKRANSEEKDEVNHKKAKQIEVTEPVVAIIEKKVDEIPEKQPNVVVETMNNNEVSSNQSVNNKDEMEISLNKTKSRSNSVESKSPSRSHSRSPSPSRSRSRSASLSNGANLNLNENKNKLNSPTNGHVDDKIEENKIPNKSKSPSISSTKSESAVKEIPMSGDRNRFSRSRSPKSRWHASPTPDPEMTDKKEPENQDEKPKVEEIKEETAVETNEKPVEKAIEPEPKNDEAQKANDTESDIPKVQRKRKWFTSNNDPLKVTKTVAISSDSLKTYLPEAKIPKTIDADILTNEVETPAPTVNNTEAVKPPHIEDNLNNNRKVIKGDQNDEKFVQRQPSRTVIIEENNELIYEDALNSNELNKSMSEAIPPQTTAPADKKPTNGVDAKKDHPANDNLIGNTDEPERIGDVSPSREPLSNIIHIKGLTRPFTLPQLKELLSKYGKIVEDKFWINNVKSHCYATYENIEEAKAAREALHRTKWPQSNPKVLRVDFATEEQFLYYQNGEKSTTGTDVKKPPIKDDAAGQRVTSPQHATFNNKKESKVTNSSSSTSELKSEPLATSNKENLKDIQQKSSNRGAEKSNASLNYRERDREREREKDRERDSRRAEKEKPIREWDLPKLKSSRSRSRDISMERRRKIQEKRLTDKKSEAKKEEPKEEEQPTKLLEDLFKKTNTTPCIYWLPLTDEQITERERLRQQRREEREKNRLENESKEKAQDEQSSKKVENNKNEDGKENKANAADDKQQSKSTNNNSKRSARSRSKSNELNGTREQSKEDKEEVNKRRSSSERNVPDKRHKDEQASNSTQNKTQQKSYSSSSSSRNDDRNRSKQSSSHQQQQSSRR